MGSVDLVSGQLGGTPSVVNFTGARNDALAEAKKRIDNWLRRLDRWDDATGQNLVRPPYGPQCPTEAGLKRIPPDQALKLSAYGIPLDWVYEGKMANLHPHIRAKIRQLQSDG